MQRIMAGEQQHGQQLADAEARRWWTDREAKAEKELSASLLKRIEAQRAQIHAFKLEQSKWEHELQLRISKYAHDRKLLSELNIELQEAHTAMEERYAKLQRENDLQAVQILELEGQLRDAQSNLHQLRDLQAENALLCQRLMVWESSQNAQLAAAVQRHQEVQDGIMASLQHKLEEVLKENERLRHGDFSSPYARACGRSNADAKMPILIDGQDQDEAIDRLDFNQDRIAELEKSCKQKDQTILSLRAMLERHEVISDNKIKLLQEKYDQVKAINVSLQTKLLHTLTDTSNGNRSTEHIDKS